MRFLPIVAPGGYRLKGAKIFIVNLGLWAAEFWLLLVAFFCGRLCSLSS
jgi:hypothetical protein